MLTLEMCVRCLATAVFLVGLAPASAVQEKDSDRPSQVSLVLPPGIASEAVQITYYMTGPFGGYGRSVKTEKNQSRYDIDASVDGKPAATIKVIAYLPGCEIVTLDIPLKSTAVEQRLGCKPLGWVVLHAQVFPVSITQEQPTEVEVIYLAEWSNRFFGITDGMVTPIRLGTVVPDEHGQFEFKLPNLAKQTTLGEGVFRFGLRRRNNWNRIASLRPAEPSLNSFGGLKVRSSYSPVVQFMAERQ